jgi:hypothetical protein
MSKSLLRLTAILLFSVQMSSCVKDHFIPIDPEPNGIENLRSAIEGKWLIDTSVATNLPEGPFLEFFWADTTYIQGAQHMAANDKYTVTSPTSITLAHVGRIENIAFSSDKRKMSFTRIHQGNQTGEQLTATRAPRVDSTKWTGWFEGKWAVLPVEDGNDTLSKTEGGILKSLFFSYHGTFITKYKLTPPLYLGNGELSQNWRWDKSTPNKVEFWDNYKGIQSDNNISIRSLTADTLKITHSSVKWGVRNLTLVRSE